MIAFFYNVSGNEYYTYDIHMRPNMGDIVVIPSVTDPADHHYFRVDYIIVNFSERIGTHYGVMISILDNRDMRYVQTERFEENVTNDIFFNRHGLIMPTTVEGGESRDS